MIRAKVIEVFHNETTTGRGEFDFLQLPAPGDRFVISTHGDIEIMRSLYVEHHPVPIPTPKSARPDAWVMIFAESIFGDDLLSNLPGLGSDVETPMDSRETPGQALAQVVAPMSPDDQALFLQRLESKAKRLGDLDYLREIKAYKERWESNKT